MRKGVAIGLAILVGILLFAIPLSLRRMEGRTPTDVPTQSSGDPASAHRVLIASEPSPFKNALVTGLVHHLQGRPVYVQVIDLSGLAQVRPTDWTAIVLLYSWEFGRPPSAARAFLGRAHDPRNLIVLTTSASGHVQLPGIDVVSSASVERDVPQRLGQIEPRLDALLRDAGP